MGFGYPAALGAKVACPNTQVIDIDGDGSFLMNVQELATAHIENIAAKAMILNNQHLGMVMQWEDRFYGGNRGHTYLGDPLNTREIYPDYVAVASSFDVKCERVMFRKDLRAAMQRMLDCDEPFVLDVVVPYTEHVLPFIPAGRTVADIAAEQGKDGVDVFLDLTLQDDLENEFTMQSFNTRIDRMAEILNDRSVLIGLGDGGAHLDMLCDAGYPTYVLGTWVRERKVLSLEEAVRRMTSDPADFFGIKDRGRIASGMAADLVLFDPATVGAAGRPERIYDLPGGAKRMVMRSAGIELTLVNGVPTWEGGALTGAAAGAVLRS